MNLKHKRRLLGGTLCLLLLGAPGCNWLTPLAFVGEHKQQVYAEFDKLPDSRTLILVWTPPETLFDYPHIRFELTSYLADKLHAGLMEKKQQVDLVDPRDVEDYLQQQFSKRIDPAEVGRHFKADYVIYLELLQFQLRSPEEPQFLRGQIESSIAVYDLTGDGDLPGRFELTPVRTVYPEKGPLVLSSTNALHVRETLYRMFAEQTARKFYDHLIDM